VFAHSAVLLPQYRGRSTTSFLPLRQPQMAAEKRYCKATSFNPSLQAEMALCVGHLKQVPGCPQNSLKTRITPLSSVVGCPGTADRRYIARGYFACFSLPEIGLYASHFMFNPQLQTHFAMLSFCGSGIAKCLLPHKISMWD
jgi:hypothetical protein